MENQGKIVEIRDRNGGLILSFLVMEKPFQETPKEKDSGGKPKENGNPLAQDAYMTDAQKRYLFRILAEHGKEGQEAHDHLKNKIFQVSSLKEVTKIEASQAIERLLAESKGGAAK